MIPSLLQSVRRTAPLHAVAGACRMLLGCLTLLSLLGGFEALPFDAAANPGRAAIVSERSPRLPGLLALFETESNVGEQDEDDRPYGAGRSWGEFPSLPLERAPSRPLLGHADTRSPSETMVRWLRRARPSQGPPVGA